MCPARIFSKDDVKSVKQIAVKFPRLRYDAENDVRDRTSPDNIEWADYIHDVIVAAGGITSTLKGYVKDEDGDQVVVILEGRTRYLALKRAIEDGTIPQEQVDQSFIKVELVPRATSIVQMTEQLVSQYVKPLTPIEEYKGVTKLLKLMADDHKEVRSALNLTVARYNAILKVGQLPTFIQQKVCQKYISLDTAHDFVKNYKGSSENMEETLNEIISSVQPPAEDTPVETAPVEKQNTTTDDSPVSISEMMEETVTPPTPPAKPVVKRVKKRDSQDAMFTKLDDGEKIAIRGEATDLMLTLGDKIDELSGYELNQIIDMTTRMLKRIEKTNNTKAAEALAQIEIPTIPNTTQGEELIENTVTVSEADVERMNAVVA